RGPAAFFSSWFRTRVICRFASGNGSRNGAGSGSSATRTTSRRRASGGWRSAPGSRGSNSPRTTPLSGGGFYPTGAGSRIGWGSTRRGGMPSRRGLATRSPWRRGNRTPPPAPSDARRPSALLREALARQPGLVAPRIPLDHHPVVALRLIHILESGVGDPGLEQRRGDLVPPGIFLGDFLERLDRALEISEGVRALPDPVLRVVGNFRVGIAAQVFREGLLREAVAPRSKVRVRSLVRLLRVHAPRGGI